jgi:hypothetical protein
MNYTRETIQKAFRIYQGKHGGTLAEVSILFVNVMDALDEAAQQGVQSDVLIRCQECGALIETDVHCDNCGTFHPTRHKE